VLLYTKKEQILCYGTSSYSCSELTVKGKSQDIPWPFCRAAIVVGPAKEGIQKKPSVRSPFFNEDTTSTSGNVNIYCSKNE